MAMEDFRKRIQQTDLYHPVALKRSANVSFPETNVEASGPPDEAFETDIGARPNFSSKSWTLGKLLKKGKRFERVRRVSALDKTKLLQELEQYEQSGDPLIIEDWHKTPNWPTDGLFSPEWLLDHGEQGIFIWIDVDNSN